MSQKVSAGTEATVIVSGGNTTIGISKEDMKEILGVVAAQLPQYAAVASAIVEQRLAEFQKRVIDRFESGREADPQAFADPDFQYLLGRSQHSFARSGEEATAEILVDLIAQRSLQSSRSRLTLSLNDAVERSAFLTQNEFAELALVFAHRHVRRTGIGNFPTLCEYWSSISAPFLPHVSSEGSSYQYLQAQSCGHIDILGRTELIQNWQNAYPGLLTKGNTEAKFLEVLGEDAAVKYPGLLRVSLHDSNQLQANAVDKEVFDKACAERGLADKSDELWGISQAGLLSEEQIVNAAAPHFPEVNQLISLWKETPLGAFALTSVGIAIGYANLSRVFEIEADLGIWIK